MDKYNNSNYKYAARRGVQTHRRLSSARKKGEADTAKEAVRAVKYIVCIIAFIAIITAKLAFPEKTGEIRENIRSALSYNVDYKSAITAVGEAFSGEKEVKEALGEAYTYAFEGEFENFRQP